MYKVVTTWAGQRHPEVAKPTAINKHMEMNNMLLYIRGLPGFISMESKAVNGSTQNAVVFDTEEHARAFPATLEEFPTGIWLDIASTKAFMAATGITRTVEVTVF